jgi:hypothetical protein
MLFMAHEECTCEGSIQQRRLVAVQLLVEIAIQWSKLRLPGHNTRIRRKVNAKLQNSWLHTGA